MESIVFAPTKGITMKLIAFLALLLTPSFSFAVLPKLSQAPNPALHAQKELRPSEQKLKKIDVALDACLQEDSSTMGSQLCLDEAIQNAEYVLKESVEKFTKRLELKAEEEHINEANKEILKLLQDSQTQWKKARSADCSLEASTMYGGSGSSQVWLSCSYKKIKERVSFLEENAGAL